MKTISRPALIGALILIFLTSACGRLSFATPTPVWTLPPGGIPVYPTTTMLAPATVPGTTLTPDIPITGENVVSQQCQFCVQNEAHAVLIFPDNVSFKVSGEIPVDCVTAAVTGGKRILVCHGTQSATFNLNICTSSSNCLQFPVALQPCPQLAVGATPQPTGTAFYLTPINTLQAPTKKSTKPTGTAVPSSTPVPKTNTPPPPPTSYPNTGFVPME